MPEYLHPGVYVEEYDGRTKPIPGVSASTAGFIGQTLAAELREVIRRAAPAWTELNAPDPGVTLLELFAWLMDSPLYRVAAIPERDRQAATRAIAALAKLADPCGAAGETLTRPRYFAGMLLDAATLQAEQDYHREKLRRHNRALHGAGIVHGLGVRVEGAADAPNGHVHVEPGYALDPCGNGITVTRGAVVALPRHGEPLFVSLRHWEKPVSPIASALGEPTPSRIEEACVIAVVDVVDEPAIGLARLLCSEGRWVVDSAFLPPRAQRVPA